VEALPPSELEAETLLLRPLDVPSEDDPLRWPCSTPGMPPLMPPVAPSLWLLPLDSPLE
jgi:hypothetical protein